MYTFEYHRPTTVADAVSLLQGASEAKLLAGGHTLIPTLKQRLAQPSDLVDLRGIGELKGIREEGDRLVIGATTTHAEVAASEVVKRAIPALASLAEHIGDAQVRNCGTIGGSIANNDPAADYPAAIVGLNATVKTNQREIAADDFFTGMFETPLGDAEHIGDAQVRNCGTIGGSIANNDPAADYPAAIVGLNARVKTNQREIAADDFFTGMFDTALGDAEIITAVSFPKPAKAGYAKFPNPASRYAIVGVMVAETGGQTRVAVTGAAPSVFRLPDFEQALAGNFAASALDGLSVPSADLNSDIHASAEYRAHLVKVMAKRAVQAASG